MDKARQNRLLHYFDGASFMVGTSLASLSVIVPAYVKSYTGNPFLLALIPVLFDVGVSIPQTISVFAARHRQARPHYHPVLAYFVPALITRMSFILIGLSIILFHNSSLGALVSFYLFFAVFNLALGYTSPHWINLLSVTTPDHGRAHFLGRRELIARLVGIGASLFVPLILMGGPFPVNYGLLFIMAGVLLTAGILPALKYHLLFPFQKQPGERLPASFLHFLREGVEILKKDRHLAGLLLIFWILSVSRISQAFYTPWLIDHVVNRYPAEWYPRLISLLNLTYLLFMAFAAFVSGRIIAWRGGRFILTLSALSLLLANVLIIGARNLPVALAGQVFLAFFAVSGYMAALTAVMDRVPPQMRSTLTALSNTVNAGFIITFSFSGSLIARFGRLEWAFGFVALVSLGLLVYMLTSGRVPLQKGRPR